MRAATSLPATQKRKKRRWCNFCHERLRFSTIKCPRCDAFVPTRLHKIVFTAAAFGSFLVLLKALELV